MSDTITVALAQMDVTPAPTDQRLARAGRLVEDAAAEGAQLVLLPEVFNTGYAYHPDNHRRAEPLDGPTVTWLRAAAARLDVHLGGTLLLLDHDEIYNAFLLAAPGGQLWRYDKHYPWGWERAYFRGGRRITVADTALGRFGMLICWDVAHRALWRRYAGRVDAMLISASPPNMGDPVYTLADGTALTASQMGPLFAAMRDDGDKTFVDTVRAQTAWLGVPTVSVGAAGHFESAMPRSRLSLGMVLPTAPWLAPHMAHAGAIRIRGEMVAATQALAADGTPLAQLSPQEGDAFCMAQLPLPARRRVPDDPQPPRRVSRMSYLISDLALPAITRQVYRRGARQAWGPHMAPLDAGDRRSRAWIALGAALAFIAGLWLGRRRSNR